VSLNYDSHVGTLPGGISFDQAADFSITDDERVKGRETATHLLESHEKASERTAAEEGLEILATVLSGGLCQGIDFPWHQVRAYHGQAAMSMLKEEGAQNRLEILRCRLDPHHKFRQFPTNFTTKQIHSWRQTLRRVLKSCKELGHLSEEEFQRATSPKKSKRPANDDRVVNYGEFCALIASCERAGNVTGLRDSLTFYLLYHGGMMLAELQAVSIDDLQYDKKTQQVSVRTGKAKNQKSRRVQLPNEALIVLEDWLESRGNKPGALLNPIRRNVCTKGKRLTGTEVRTIVEKRAEEAGVEYFTVDDLRKSTAAQVRMSNREAKAESIEIAIDPLFGPDETSTTSDQAEMARICFPFLENRTG
jgi:integrase